MEEQQLTEQCICQKRLYVLVPGVYLVVREIYLRIIPPFIGEVIFNSLLIGVGAWTGTFSVPNHLGTTAIERLELHPRSEKEKDKRERCYTFKEAQNEWSNCEPSLKKSLGFRWLAYVC
jgi:hypothetical protein